MHLGRYDISYEIAHGNRESFLALSSVSGLLRLFLCHWQVKKKTAGKNSRPFVSATTLKSED
jgi:hypothetical protein